MAAITFQPMPTTAVGIASTVAYGVASSAAFTVNSDFTGTVGLSTNAAGLGILSNTREGCLRGRRPWVGQQYPRGVLNK